MPIQTLIEQNRKLIHETLREHFGVDTVKSDELLASFLAEFGQSEPLRQDLATSDAAANRLLVEIRNHAFRQLTRYDHAGRQFHSSVESSAADSPRFSASEVRGAETVWTFQLLAPVISMTMHSAARSSDWRLFEETRLRPLITGRQRPSFESVATSLGYQNLEQARVDFERERQRWLAFVDYQLRCHRPHDLPPERIETWVTDQNRSLARVVQKMVGAGFSESEDQLRCVQQLLSYNDEQDGSEEAAHLRSGLRIWEGYLQERIDHWDEPRYIYDVNVILSSHPNYPTPRDSVRADRDGVVVPPSSEITPLAESIEQILNNLKDVLKQPLPCESDLFMAEYFADPATPFSRGMTIEQLLFAAEPPEHGLRILKDVAKQEGEATAIEWHMAVAKLIYFAAIAAYIVRVNPRPARITSLSYGELRHALQWAASLPEVESRIRELFEQATEILDRYHS